MRVRTATAIAAATAALTAASPAHAAQPKTCTWAGTPVAPTGVFWITPGITNTPSRGPLEFVASAELAGGRRCRGTMKFIGQLDAGASCPYSTFRGRVRGLPGVRRYLGHGSLDVPSQLFDRKGNASGAYDAPATSYVVVLDKSGRVVYTGLGGQQDLEPAIRKALSREK